MVYIGWQHQVLGNLQVRVVNRARSAIKIKGGFE